jgi:hypothetical protein
MGTNLHCLNSWGVSAQFVRMYCFRRHHMKTHGRNCLFEDEMESGSERLASAYKRQNYQLRSVTNRLLYGLSLRCKSQASSRHLQNSKNAHRQLPDGRREGSNEFRNFLFRLCQFRCLNCAHFTTTVRAIWDSRRDVVLIELRCT